MELFDQSLVIMQKSMDLRMANQHLIASNLANVDTPGFIAQRLDFEASMAQAMNDLENPETPTVVEPSAAAPRTLDGNNVDLERELSELSRNRMMYTLTSQLLAAKFRQLSSVAQEQA